MVDAGDGRDAGDAGDGSGDAGDAGDGNGDGEGLSSLFGQVCSTTICQCLLICHQWAVGWISRWQAQCRFGNVWHTHACSQ